MLDAATAPAAAHLDLPEPGDALELSTDLAAAYAAEPVVFTGTLAIPRRVLTCVAGLHEKHCASVRTRKGRRSLSGGWEQAVCWCRVIEGDAAQHPPRPDRP